MTAPDLTPEERAEVIRFGVHEPEIFDAMESDLEGATTPGDPAAWAKDPGEFAARYNSWTPERRHAWAERIVQDSMTAARCHQADHDGELVRLRGIAVDRAFPATDAQVDAALEAWFAPALAGSADRIRAEVIESHRDRMRAALEAARRAA